MGLDDGANDKSVTNGSPTDAQKAEKILSLFAPVISAEVAKLLVSKLKGEPDASLDDENDHGAPPVYCFF